MVAQCGWYVGADADWADTTGGAKFRPDAYCVPPAGADPFDGDHLKSFTRDGQATVSGTRFARWRWVAPPGTGSPGSAAPGGTPSTTGSSSGSGPSTAAVASTSSPRPRPPTPTPRDFVAGFSPAGAGARRPPALRAGGKQVVRARTRLLVGAAGADDHARRRRARPAPASAASSPARAGTAGTVALSSGGQRRRQRRPLRRDDDRRRPGRPRPNTPARRRSIGGEWRGTTDAALPRSAVAAGTTVDTTGFSDGPHSLATASTDFAGNVGCTAPRTVLIDNNPPAHPRSPRSPAATAGAGSTTSTSLGRTPTRAPASPIAGACWRITGPGRLRHRRAVRAGRGSAPLRDLHGAARRRLHACALAARRSRQRSVEPRRSRSPLRFDDVPPGSRVRGSGRVGVPTRSAPTSPTPTRARRRVRSPTAGSAADAGSSCRPS